LLDVKPFIGTRSEACSYRYYAPKAKLMPTPPKKTSRNLRGSQKLLQGLAKNGEEPSLEAIKKALALPGNIDLRVPNWLIRGIPPAYLELDATLQVPITGLSEVVNRFVQLNDSTVGLKILINGIPVPDLATIQVTNTPGEG
jgi:hypothetical protein